MSYKTILVHLDGHARNEQTLRLACDLAGRFEARLAAVYALEQPLFAAAMDPGAAAALTFQADLDSQMQAKARAMVTAAEQRSGLAIEWRCVSSNTANNLILHARHADLLVMTQEDRAEKLAIDPTFAASIVIGAGRPVLMVPYAGQFQSCGASVLIAWSGTRESARAVADALPLMKQADEINVVSFNPKGDSQWGEIPGADIGLWLTRHGLRVNVRQQKSDEVDVGNQILSLASDFSSDLIVMGAYGHSRTFQFVLGGVTRTLFESMTVPVLMSH
jgi:nucleotide-binding universal stress UspA family protein